MALGFGALDSSQKAPFRVSGFHEGILGFLSRFLGWNSFKTLNPKPYWGLGLRA